MNMNKQTLEQKLSAVKEIGSPFPEVPNTIKNNLNPLFQLRPYQIEAFSRFIFYRNNPNICQKPTQLLFHMATGSGKTLIMAGAILYLYEQGYRNFIFFVNSTNIINKTRDNFLNFLSSKYLFSENITFGEKQVKIKEVESFQAVNQEDINIVFSTIQALHTRLNTPRENSITYDDFADKKIVLLSDEAHHINAETKKGKELTKEEKEEIISWEGTVSRIFRANSDNILLEFTATIDFSNTDIVKKYSDKLLFDYPLKQFRIDGYSKEVKVLQADIPQIERGLQALILSQYRRKIFEQYKKIIKPVILFKSKTINESKIFFEDFVNTIKNLKTEDLQKINERDNDRAIKKAFKYFEDNNIALENLISEIKEDFSLEKCIEINSKEESEEKQIAVNTLEDETNEYRAIFAVDKLNEGWDVLNLFDIVRLHDTRDAKDGKPGKTTMSEAQLIGRGARYCPFQIVETQPKYQRKYDEDIERELRICEELYYHSAYNPRYIQELNTALQEIGIKAKESREIPLQLKLDFKESELYKNGFIFLNDRRKYDRSDISTLPALTTEQSYKVRLRTGIIKSSIIFESAEQEGIDTRQKDYHLADFRQNILRKAINKLEFYQFNNLKSFLPNLESISEFITSKNYLEKVKVEVEGNANQIKNLTPQQKLDIVIEVLEKVSPAIISDKVEFEGTPEFKPYEINKTFKDKTLNIYVREGSDQEYGVGQKETNNPDLKLDLSNKEWYVFNDNYGTSEEKYLIKFINKTYDELKAKYSKVYLVRNEKYFQLYNFDDGRAMEPDFVLFLEKKGIGQVLHYQIFIEPKGEHLLREDEWKENFLRTLKEKAEIQVLWKTKKFIVWGMPFYNEQLRKVEFENEFGKIIND
ncbi:DEAD/DEAH box helicase family protein [bacterium]|nr:DEAD/DEAH box helicase family protein [bacterium]